jgi:hypothetical protein
VIIRLKRIETGPLSQAEPLDFVSDHTVNDFFAGTQGRPRAVAHRQSIVKLFTPNACLCKRFLAPRPPGRTEAPQHREAGLEWISAMR